MRQRTLKSDGGNALKGNVKEIVKVFDGADRELVIPVYQRNYDWGVKQCERLFDDLVDVIKHDRPKHFFGAVVGKNETSFRWLVIDGQQRLTTTSLLMLALANALDDGLTTSTEDHLLSTKIRRNFLFGADNSSTDVKLKLKPVKNDFEAYRKLVSGDGTESLSTITTNYNYFYDRISRNELTGDQLWDAINRLESMVLDLESHDDPQRIFESLNSTGKELTESDKIRNLVLMGLPENTQQNLYEYFWNVVEINVGYDMDTFIRQFLIVQTRRIPRFDAIYDAFRAYIETTSIDIKEIMLLMRDFSEYYRDLGEAHTGVPTADVRLQRLNMLRHDVAMPTLMSLLRSYRAQQIDSEDFADSIILIDSYLFRRIIVGAQTNALNKIFATLFNEAQRLRLPDTRMTDVLTYLLLRREASGRFPDNEEFYSEFFARNVFNLQTSNRRYLFECLENLASKDRISIAAKLESGDLSVEHIMPQTLTKQWREHLGSDAEEIHSTWLHRLGNLTITGYNSEYSNSPFSEKKTIPGGFNDSPYRINKALKTTDVWGAEQIRKRTESLVNQAVKYWPMPGTNFEPKREPMPTHPMGEETTFTNTTVVAYEFDDSKVTVQSYKELMIGVIRQLLTTYREKILQYAGNPTAPGFEIAESPRSRAYEEIEPGLWAAVNVSTKDKMSTLRSLFHFLQIDTEELVITIRQEGTATSDNVSKSTSPDRSNHRYARLIKYRPEIEELEDTAVSSEDAATIREKLFETLGDFKPFESSNAQIERSQSKAEVEQLTANDILVLLSFVKQTSSMMPSFFNNFLQNGTLSLWLRRLEDVG